MLLHLNPRLLLVKQEQNANIVSVEIPELSLILSAGREIAATRPYPNKRYLSVARIIDNRISEKHGILLNVNNSLTNFTVITIWKIEDSDHLCIHTVHYQLIDRDFDCASDCMLLWHGVFGEKFKSRFPLDLPEDTTPLNTQPRMDVSSGSNKKTRGVESEELDNKGYVISRVERFNLPTIEQERITGDAFGLSIKFPTLSDAFLCLTNGADNDYG
ncbi:hypothetical protein G3489_19385 [Shewanella baltica]|uniref:DUF6012 family protein n=1 Tax=Shewanella baltica TaxID=62322 RepID=UPI00217D5DDE|nr:DUF6012 family protein [Shewanella baltica]MCS6271840.1 hypothetical protein [Shewanella baltica]